MKNYKVISFITSAVLTLQILQVPVFATRDSNMVAPTIDVPEFTLQLPDNMPSAYDSLAEKYDNSLSDLKEQGWGENNYEDGLANKLEAPEGFGTEVAEDVFMTKYGTEVMNQNWMDFGLGLYSENKFNAQQTLVSSAYNNNYLQQFNNLSSQYKTQDLAGAAQGKLPGDYDSMLEFAFTNAQNEFEDTSLKLSDATGGYSNFKDLGSNFGLAGTLVGSYADSAKLVGSALTIGRSDALFDVNMVNDVITGEKSIGETLFGDNIVGDITDSVVDKTVDIAKDFIFSDKQIVVPNKQNSN